MAYVRTKAGAEKQVAKRTTGATATGTTPNYGTTVINDSSAEVYVLEPPVAGCRKRLIFTTATTGDGALPIVKSSTTPAAGVSAITFVGATTGINTLTLTTARILTQPTIVELEGLNSTSWIITSIWPNTSVAVGSVTRTSA
jgi:hypothetical protein